MPEKNEKALKYLNAAKFEKAISLYESTIDKQSPSNKRVHSY